MGTYGPMGLAMGTYGLTHGNESVARVSDSEHISNDDNGRTPSLEVCARGRADFNIKVLLTDYILDYILFLLVPKVPKVFWDSKK